MYRHVILADDGSPAARGAIPRTAALAAAYGSEVLVIRVSRAEGVRPQDLSPDEWRVHVSPEGRAAARVDPLEAEPHLHEAVDELQRRGVAEAGSVVVHGEASDALIEAARGLGADLLVLSSRGGSGLRRAVLGSVAERLIHEAREIPVLLCPATETVQEASLRRVMLTLDGSDLAERALPHAEGLARALGAELVLLRVVDGEADLLAASMASGSPPVASIPAGTALEVAERERIAALAALEAHAAALRARGVERVDIQVADGRPADAILAAAEGLAVDVLVMATHGRGGLGRLVLGSVADEVARHMERSAVLLVRP